MLITDFSSVSLNGLRTKYYDLYFKLILTIILYISFHNLLLWLS